MRQCYAQNYANKEFYLVDSLDLNALHKSDKQLIDSCLKIFHQTNDDTIKVQAIEYIVDGCMDDKIWTKYDMWVYVYVENKLKTHTTPKIKKNLLISFAGALNNIGYLSKQKGDIPKAMEYYHKSIRINENIGNKEGLAISLSNIGAIYDSQDDIPNAIEYYHRSLKIEEEIDDKEGIALTLNNIGAIYDKQGDLPNAIEYYYKSFKIGEEIGYKWGMALSLNNIGVIYDSQGDLLKAIEYYHKSLKIREEIGDKYGISTSLNNIGDIQLTQGNVIAALAYAEKSLIIAEEIGYPDLIKNSANLLSRVYEKQGKHAKALSMYKLHIKMRDSLISEENTKALVQQQAKYEYEKQKVIDDAEHEKEIAIEQKAKEKQTILTYATGGGLGLVGIFLLIVFNRLKVTRKQKNIIEEQKHEVEHQKEVVEQAHSELEEKNKEITDSIQYAKRIQSAILPPAKDVKAYLKESFILYKPKDIVAGDFYWLESVEEKVLFAAADCTGHGVPGAMVSVVCNNGLNRSVREYNLTDPGKILDKTREIVVKEFEKSEEEVKDGMDIALCSLEGNKLQYAGAHNPLWIIRKDSNEIEEIKANKQPIGKFDNPEPYITHTIELQKGDSVYIFSDGYADQFGGEKGKKLKTANFKKLLLSIQNENMQKQKELIDEAFEKWKGNLEQLDDVCVIGVRI